MTARDPPSARRAGLPSAVRLLLSVALAAAMFWFLTTRVDVRGGWSAARDEPARTGRRRRGHRVKPAYMLGALAACAGGQPLRLPYTVVDLSFDPVGEG